MSRDIQLRENWDRLVEILSESFSGEEKLDLEAIIFLVGVQEYGKVNQVFTKDEKINLMHIGICRLLEPYGYYEFDYYDPDGWAHYRVKQELPNLKAGEQTVLMKEAIVEYFVEKNVI